MARTSVSKKPYERPSSRTTEGLWLHDRAPGVPQSVLNTAGKAPTGAVLDTKLVVSNLHYNVTIKDLVDIFGQVGTLVEEPRIKYDRSGRSTGIAYIHYETKGEAAKALKNYDGKLAKGERMSISYDTLRVHPGARRAVSAPSSLADRIQKPPLLARLGAETTTAAKDNSTSRQKAPTETGPVRNRKPRRGGSAGGNPRPEKFRKEAKTQEDLDKELDAFMADDSAPAAAQPNGGDIEMA